MFDIHFIMNKKTAFYIGLSLIIVSFLFAVMSYYMLFFCIPAFIIGLLFLWFSSANTRNKILLTFLPILLYFPFSIGFLYWNNYQPYTDVYLPIGFSGSVRLVYNENCASAISINQKKRSIHIPPTGIFLCKDSLESGSAAYHFYIPDEKGEMQKLKLNGPFGDKDKNVKEVFFLGTTIFDAEEENYKILENKGFVSLDFYVNPKGKAYSPERKYDKQIIQDLLNEVVSCRNTNK